MKRAVFIVSVYALCLAATPPVWAQQEGLRHTVEVSASVQLPADAIFLTIRLHQQAESARKAFTEHGLTSQALQRGWTTRQSRYQMGARWGFRNWAILTVALYSSSTALPAPGSSSPRTTGSRRSPASA